MTTASIEAARRVLVTGGGGFLGGAIVRKLLARGVSVTSFARSDYPELAALGVHVARGDLADEAAVVRAAEGCDAIVHVAALPGVWGPYAHFFAANVTGTRNVLAACRAHSIARLVHTSTPSVVHAGGDLEGVDNTAPYPAHYESAYPETKAIAEREVLAANGTTLPGGATLATVALRPHLVWGPGDNHLIPRIVARARAGKLRLVGGGRAKVDTVYVDNAADAHLAALERLAPGAACAGKAYFITNEDPRPQREIIGRILVAHGLPPCERSIAPRVAWLAGAAMEGVWRLSGRADEPMMTRFLAKQLATSHWYDTRATRDDLGYRPAISIDEGFERLAAHARGNASAYRTHLLR
jgi:nucleoside-diphosphate-sugar epimerase